MARQPDFVRIFLQHIPRKWDDVKFFDGFPGKYVVMARKSGEKWYVAGINSQSENQHLTIDLSKLKKVIVNSVTLITDGVTNRSFTEQNTTLKNNMLEVEMKSNGGFVLIL